MYKYSFRKYQPLTLRLWHWLNAAAILGLLGTVLMRKTFLSWRTNSEVIQTKLIEAGTTITPDLAKEIAVAIRNPLWDWHIYLGFSLGVLFLVRLLVVKTRIDFQGFKNILRIKGLPVDERAEALHVSLVKIGYLVFYCATALMIASGLALTYKSELSLSKDFAGNIKEVHEFMMWFFVIFVAGHIGGVVLAENRKDQGLISDMINGGNPENK